MMVPCWLVSVVGEMVRVADSLFGGGVLDASMLADKALGVRGEAFFNPKTGARFDPKSHGVEMSNVTLDMKHFDMSEADVARSLSSQIGSWSFLLGMPDHYLHAKNDGRDVAVGVSVADIQRELEKSFALGFGDLMKQSRPEPRDRQAKPEPSTRRMPQVRLRPLDSGRDDYDGPDFF